MFHANKRPAVPFFRQIPVHSVPATTTAALSPATTTTWESQQTRLWCRKRKDPVLQYTEQNLFLQVLYKAREMVGLMALIFLFYRVSEMVFNLNGFRIKITKHARNYWLWYQMIGPEGSGDGKSEESKDKTRERWSLRDTASKCRRQSAFFLFTKVTRKGNSKL